MANFVLTISVGSARVLRPEPSLIPVDHRKWNLEAPSVARYPVTERKREIVTDQRLSLSFDIVSTAAKFTIFGFSSITEMVQRMRSSERSVIPFGSIVYECMLSSCHRDDHLVAVVCVDASLNQTSYSTTQRTDYSLIKYAASTHISSSDAFSSTSK